MSAPDADPFTDRYGLERELGRGGMATVWLARDLKHDRLVALKLLRPDIALALGRERFLREIRIAAQLEHPHILQLYDSGEFRGQLYYVMPYVTGESLRARLEREAQLSLEDALRITRQVASALEYAHRHRVVHRDIKPENILLSESGALVADFGIARALDAAGGERLTETGLALGTPAYMSPEQATDGRRLDGRSDIYALGCVLYEMLAGQPPFTGPTAQSILMRHAVDPVPPIRTIRPTVPDRVQRSIEKALAKVPADRWPTVARFADAIEGATEEMGPHYRRPRRPRPALLAGLAAAAVALATAAAAARGWIASPWTDAAQPLGPAGGITRVVAVLPFEDVSTSGEDRYYGVSLSEEVARMLARIPSLRVIDPTLTHTYGDSVGRVGFLREKLRADGLVEAQVRVVDRSLAVSLRVLHAATGRAILSKLYRRDLSDVYTIQAQLVRDVAEVIGVLLTEAENRELDLVPTRDMGAYDLYLRSLALTYHNDAENLAGISLLQQAIRRDSTFASAYALLARRHLFRAWLVDPIFGDSGLVAAQRAVALQPDLALAHFALGDLHSHAGRPNTARLSYLRALDLDRNLIGAMADLSDADATLGRFDESLHWALRAIRVAPDNSDLYFHAAVPLYHLDVDAVTERWLDAAVRRWPWHARLVGYRARLGFVQGKDTTFLSDLRHHAARSPEDEEGSAGLAVLAAYTGAADAEALLTAQLKTNPDAMAPAPESFRTLLALVRRRAGDLAGARRLEEATLAHLGRQLAGDREDYALQRELAAIHALRGEATPAVEWLEEAYQRGERDYRFLDRDPFFQSVRSDPRFRALLARMASDVAAMRRRAMEANDSLFAGVASTHGVSPVSQPTTP